MDEIIEFLNGEGDWNTNNVLKATLRLSVTRILQSLYLEPSGGETLKDFGAAAAALGPIKAMRKRPDPTPTNAAEKTAIATLKNLFATIDDDAAYAKLL